MRNFKVTYMKKNIKHTWFINHPVERVWEYLTTPEHISEWLMKNNFKPEVGYKFQFHTKPLLNLGFDGIVYCEVLEVIHLKKLSYTWKGGPGKGKITLDSVVIWTLLSKNGGTELTLEHKGFEGFKNFLGYIFMNSGWKAILRKRLPELINSQK